MSRLLSFDRGELIFGGKVEEGVRRAICDMTLLFFHLILSGFTFDGVDISVASKIIKWNLKRFPNGIPVLCNPRIHLNVLLFLKGVFFLLGAGRLSLCRSQPERAIKYFSQALRAQSQYRNIHHASHWEIAIASLSLWDIKPSLGYWTELEKDATVSEFITLNLARYLLFFSGRNRFIRMEWLFVCWRLEVMMMIMMRRIIMMQRQRRD